MCQLLNWPFYSVEDFTYKEADLQTLMVDHTVTMV